MKNTATPVKLTRRVGFSSGHRYWFSDLTEAENKSLFGQWASPFYHGHNYFLEVTIEGVVDESTGMVVNIKWLDDLLQEQVVTAFDQKSLNDQVPELAKKSPCLENLLAVVAERLASPTGLASLESHHPLTLLHLKLEESPTLWGELNLRENAMTLTRTYEFAASHRLHAPGLNEEENLRLFGKCNNPAGHGHNYVLEVTVGGSPDPATGMIVDLGALDAFVDGEVLKRYDHKNLNEDVPELRGKVTTSEVVAQAIFERLSQGAPSPVVKVRLWETARNAFEVSAR